VRAGAFLFGGQSRNRTDNPRFTGAPLFQIELSGLNLVRVDGFEPPTPPSQAECALQTALYPDILEPEGRTILSPLKARALTWWMLKESNLHYRSAKPACSRYH
jgi:hypothetical protein